MEDWLIEAAERFISVRALAESDSCQYILYLYLQSVNAFFHKALLKPYVAQPLTELCTMIRDALKGKTFTHPKPLIAKHTAMLAHAMGNAELAAEMREILVKCFHGDEDGVTRTISGGALLAVEMAMGNHSSAFAALKENIERSIRSGIFCDELFRNALTDCRSLLDCFRFKHT